MGGFIPLGAIELVGRDYIFELTKHYFFYFLCDAFWCRSFILLAVTGSDCNIFLINHS